MSPSKSRRPPIPAAFMSPEWSPQSSPKSVSKLDEIPAQECTCLGTSNTSSPLPTNISFSATSSLESLGNRPTGHSIQTNLRDLKQRKAALRKTKKKLEPEPTLEVTEVQSPSASIRSTAAPPSEVFAFTPPPSAAPAETLSVAASLRSMRNSLRVIKARQASIRKEREDQRLAAEKTARTLSEQHRANMLHLCQLEERAHSSRWELVRNLDSREGILRFAQIPWPVLPPFVETPQQITIDGVSRFLLCTYRQPHLTEYEKLVAEQERWTDPEFEAQVLLRVRTAHRENVREGRKRLCAVFDILLSDSSDKLR